MVFSNSASSNPTAQDHATRQASHHPVARNHTACNPTTATEPPSSSRTESAPLLQALNGIRPWRTPVWFMRQAGRSLPEYRQARAGIDMLTACTTPDLTAELTLQPVRRYGVDGAIFFSDIVTPLFLAGVGVEIVKGRGPVFDQPVSTLSEVERLTQIREFDPAPIIRAAQLVRRELPAEVALLGFAGAPFTLASYLVAGASSKGGNKNHLPARALMKAEPAAWHKLAAWCAELSAQFLAAQIEGGAQAVQLFDSWAGDLSAADYREYCQPYSARVLAAAHAGGVRTIHFGVGTAHLLPDLREAGADCLGIDWRTPLDQAVQVLTREGAPRPILQGNLDPAILFCPPAAVRQHVEQVLRAGQSAQAQIVNLGHGVPPEADPQVLQLIVDLVHQSDLQNRKAH